jgi:hypothetical protein
MIPMEINLDGDKAWPDLADKPADAVVQLDAERGAIKIAVLDGGTASGRPSVMLRFELPDGRTVLAETTARLFCTAGRMITARWPDLFEGD